MVSNVIRASVVGASSSVLAIATVVLKRKRTSTSRPREPKVDQEIARERYMKSILCRGEQHCVDQIRMKPSVFFKLCETLEEKNLLQKTRNMSIKEQVLMFLHLVGHNVRLRVIGGRFYRSIETVHRYFKIVLRAILMLFNLVVRQPDDSTPTEIRYNNRFYPYFKDCIGAIDGSLIRAKVSEQLAGRFRGRKGGTTQNILATISFDLKFTYVLAGWEGSAHDSRIIRDALERPGGLVIPEEEANLGNKPSNTFKPASFVRVANLVSEKFATECSTKHVINHLRTIGGIWKTITTIRGKSGFGWDDNLKMITCSKESYTEEIAAHHKHAKFLNKKIEMFDEMAIVVGKDMATGSFAKSFNDIELEASNEIRSAKDGQDNDVEDLTTGKEVSSIGTSSKTRSHRKRPREDGETSIEVLAGQIGEMTNAIKKLSDDKVNTQELYKEVMKSEGFDEEFLSCVFDYLNANHSLAQGFMVKSPHLRKKWIERYMTNEWKGY